MESTISSSVMEEFELMKLAKYRVYLQNIDKSLKNFEYSSEWADLISALGKLNKVISSYPQFQVIPRRIKISKRLAQCMHPCLPSGVHLKALETYDVIFSNTGLERLASELFIYSAGLFPLLGYAAMNVRPTLLEIYEKYFVPLKDRLRPALSGFLNGVLPAHETGLDHYERTNHLLKDVCKSVGPVYFYTCLWECVATNSSIRLPAITFVLDNYNKKLGMSEQSSLMGRNIDLMMSGLCACLNDSVILVQRNTLEFLLLGFPLHTSLLSETDLVRLVTNGLNTILRRDMSLNRRLYSWLLGTEVNKNVLIDADLTEIPDTSTDSSNSNPQSYFEQHSKSLLIKALKIAYKTSVLSMTPDLRPHKILLSLLDKVEIGPAVLDAILIDVIRAVVCMEDSIEVKKSANTLFGNLDPYYIWNFLTNQFENACKNPSIREDSRKLPADFDTGEKLKIEVAVGEPSLVEICYLLERLLDILSLEMFNETTRIHLPKVLFAILKIITIYANDLREDEVTASIKVCMKIVTQVQPIFLDSTKVSPKFRKVLEEKLPPPPPPIVVSSPPSLEKSKSDSKLNQRAFEGRDHMKRSKSNHSMGRKKSQKKTKKTKSLSKVSELDKDIVIDNDNTCSEQGQLLLASNTSSVPNLDEVHDNKMKEKCPIQDEVTATVDSSFVSDLSDKKENSEYQHQKYTILEKCSRQYEIFFEVYVSLRLLKVRCEKMTEDKQSQKSLNHFKDEHLIEQQNDDISSKVNSLFATLEVEPNCRMEKLQNLLNQTVSKDSTDSDEMSQDKTFKQSTNEASKILNEIIALSLNPSMRRSVKFAEQLLVLMSTIPNYDQTLPIDFQDEKEIPPWLKVLVLSAVYFKSDADLRINCISTLFELIGIVKCQKEKIPNSDVHNLVMLPLMKYGHVVYVEKRTRIFHILISTLWDYLGKEDKLVDAPQIAFLLYQLHSCLESGLVEKIISERLGNSHLIWPLSHEKSSSKSLEIAQNSYERLNVYKHERLNGIKIMLSLPQASAYDCVENLNEKQSSSFKKFELLWHFGREQKESFDKILLKIYDSMGDFSSNSSLRTFIEKWLKEAMLRGDIGRLLMPLLKTMLSSSSKRISISNIHLLNEMKSNNIFDDKANENNEQQTNRVENEVYVIKMGDGAVTNHLESNKKKSPIGSIPKKIFNLATNKSAYSGQKMREKGLMPSLSAISLESEANNISLIVNPLEDQESGYVSKSCPNSIVDDNPSDSSSEYTSTSVDSLSDNEASDIEKMTPQNISKLHDESGQAAEEFFSVISTNSSKMSESEDKSLASRVDEKTSDEEIVIKKSPKHQKPTLKKKRKQKDRKIANERLEKGKANVKILKKNLESDEYEGLLKVEKLHPFHTHLLMYYGVYDTKQVLYCIETMKNVMLGGNFKLFLCLSINTSASEVQLKHLLIRHRKSIFGKGFDGSLSNTEFNNAYRGVMYIEILITLLLYYARSYFPPCANFIDSEISGEEDAESRTDSRSRPSYEDILMNNNIQLVSIEVLTMIFNELFTIVKEMGKGLASFIADLLVKCKVQKVILHCVLSSVHYFTMRSATTVSDRILKFNDPGEEKIHLEAIQLQLLKLLESLIKLEYETIVQKGEENILKDSTTQNSRPFAASLSSIISQSPTRPHPIGGGNANSIKFIANLTISQQPMFLTSVLSALNSEQLKHMHKNWTELVTSSLKCFSADSRSNIVVSVMHQICENIDKISKPTPSVGAPIPSEYCLSLLEALTVICHFCLLDNNQQVSLSHLFNPTASSGNSGHSSSYPGQIYSNILNLFLSTSSLPIVGETYSKHQLQQNATRICVLSHLPRILSSMAFLWENEIGEERLIKQQLLEFLTPIALHHGCNFIAAISVVWHERADRKLPKNVFKFQQPANESQRLLIKLVQSIKVMPFESLVQTVNSVIKSPPQIYRPPTGFTLSLSSLEFFYVYIKDVKSESLSESWVSLLSLLKDSTGLPPPAQFILFCILHDFCKDSAPKDKKDLRDVHDITTKFIDTIAGISGACLEQTTWLRRNLAVKEGFNDDQGTLSASTSISQYSIEAQSLLAQFLVSLLDYAFGSQEKDKITQIIATLMYNIVPYLKNHTAKNVPFFYSCSNLLSALTNYQFTRKAWRKDVFDLFLDHSFFQMDSSCLGFWKQIIDNLMSFDNMSFRELLNRLSIAPTGTLNIFTSKEQEYEQKALLLRKLAFVIFCSEKDQYQKYMPEIQEQLSNCLRLPQVIPCVQAAVLLCFRVLLLRMSTENVTSLWPTIIAEVVQVFIFIEQELMTDTEEFSQHIRMLSGLDTAWISNSNNGLSSHSHPSWRTVQLETAKLLELGCVLPATNLPHFQMYRWAFVGSQHDYFSSDIVDGNDTESTPASKFIPHVSRIAQLMDLRYTTHSPTMNKTLKGSHLVLTCQSIASLQDLYGFFSTLSARWPSFHHTNIYNDSEVESMTNEIEQVLSLDFLENLPTSGR